MEKIYTKTYKSEEFLQAISFGGELYSLMDGQYVFRGHASEKWNLIPSALREGAFDNMFYDDEHRIKSIRNDKAPDWECLQIDREIEILRNFYEKCDKYGLPISEIERLRKTVFSSIASDVVNKYEDLISEDFYELAALAQHYGLPTRLLDWSYSLLTALYFAVSGTLALKESEITPNIVLWALDTRVTDPSYHKESSLKMIRPKYDANPNLCAQKGLFTFWAVKKGENPMTHKGNIDTTLRSPLDELISNKIESADKPLMYKIIISKDNLPELYRYMKSYHIEAAILFAGYYGVVRNIKENQSFFLKR